MYFNMRRYAFSAALLTIVCAIAFSTSSFNMLKSKQAKTYSSEVVHGSSPVIFGNECVESYPIRARSNLAHLSIDSHKSIEDQSGHISVFSFHTQFSVERDLDLIQLSFFERFLHNHASIHVFIEALTTDICNGRSEKNNVSYHCVKAQTLGGPSNFHAEILNWATDFVLPHVWKSRASGVLFVDGDVLPTRSIDLFAYMQAGQGNSWRCLHQLREGLQYCWPGFLLLSAHGFTNVTNYNFQPMCGGDTGAWFDKMIAQIPPSFVKMQQCSTQIPAINRIWTELRSEGQHVDCFGDGEEAVFTHLMRTTSTWAEESGIIPTGTVHHRIQVLQGKAVADPPIPLRPGSKSKTQSDNKRTCALAFERYVPSTLELQWKDLISNRSLAGDYPHLKSTSSYCAVVLEQLTAIKTWLSEVKKKRQPEDQMDGSIFSQFVYRNSCTGHKISRWIEPLFGVLRDPRAFCEMHFDKSSDENIEPWYNRVFVLSHEYILHEEFHPDMYDGNVDRNLMFDLGASVYLDGPGGVSQQYFQETYEARGLAFDRAIMWEANPKAIQDLWPQVPGRFFHNYQMMNVPVTASYGDEKNPLNIIKKITTPSDFVVFKLDIDTDELEQEFYSQIMESPSLKSRIKEFFWEQHGDSFVGQYRKLSDMRYIGIRAHAWP